MAAPLLGHNLVRLTYLDEAGSDQHAPFLCVAGVLVHGDHEWPEVDRRIAALIEKHIPDKDRLGFYFHATDVFHGSGYFDRRKPEWCDQAKRIELLNELGDIIGDLHLPVVYGVYEKRTFGKGVLEPSDDYRFRDRLIHDTAVLDCLVRTDHWLEKYAPSELATVIHEDGTPAKPLIKISVQFARSADHLKAHGFADGKTNVGLPLRRIIDTVHFADKSEARPLQLADLCAFILGRGFKDKEVPARALEVIYAHLKWIMRGGDSSAKPSAPSVEGQPS